jgi:hypothetical protein
MRISRGFLGVHAVVLSAMWVPVIFLVYQHRGLFDYLGIDYALFSTGAEIMFSSHPGGVYDLDVVAQTLKPYSAYYGPDADPLRVGPLPYTTITFLQFTPFAFLPPRVGYGLWLAVNLALAIVGLRSFATRFGDRSCEITALALTFFPLVYTLFVGQPIIVMILAFAQAYRSWERDRDFEAGLWLGVLFTKVQYPAILILVLLYKLRWRSLAGMATSGLVALFLFLVAFGLRGPWSLLATIRAMSGFRSVHVLLYPQHMICWRGLLVNWLPASVSEGQGKAITLVLSALTAGTLLLIWRGRWDPNDRRRFAARMLATMIVTVLSSFHSHIHGATLLLVPAMAYLAAEGEPTLVGWLIRAGLYLPTVVFSLTFMPKLVAYLFIGLMTAALGAIIASEWRDASAPSPGSELRSRLGRSRLPQSSTVAS